MSVAKEELEELIATAEQTDEEMEADFVASYEGSDPEDTTEPVETEETEATPPAEAAAETTADTVAEAPPDELAGVPEAVRTRLSEMDKLAARLRNVEGHIGGLNSTLKQMNTAAQAAASQQGAASPTPEQVTAAIDDAEEWASIKAEYPEWASGFEKQMAVMEKRMSQKLPQVDISGLRTELGNELAESSRAIREQVRAEVMEEIRLDMKHESWRDDVKTPEFTNWFNGQPPVVQALANSKRAADAISLMDSFKAHKAAQAATTQPAQSRPNKRLETAVAPTKGAQARSPVKTEEDEFMEAYRKT